MKKSMNLTKLLFSSIIMLFLVILYSCHSGTHRERFVEPTEHTKAYEEELAMDEVDGYDVVKKDEKKEDFNTEEYDKINENEFKDAKQNPLSTFSIDVDNASYSNVRRYLGNSQMPPIDAVRIEEMINYFDYGYPQPEGEHPFSFLIDVASCPWKAEHKLVRIGIQGKKLDLENLKPSNLVFLLDVSGSMEDDNKLPLVKKALKIALDELSEKDRIAIVVYAGAAGLILPSTPATEKNKIIDAFDKLMAGGSTAGGEGIELAYKIAKENLIPDGNNRVILATDGDFNVGSSSTSDMVRLIEEKRKDNIYLTICGFGMGNYKDGRMEQISNAGNGNYFYIDNIKEAEKVFRKDLRANMFTIAKDVKIQVEFNPAIVKGYRLIGYENRVMANEDFNDDKKDAGELGAGHNVTALYEIVPLGASTEVRKTDDLKYQENKTVVDPNSKEILTIKFRYKPIDKEESILVTKGIENANNAFTSAPENFRFAASVAGFGMMLRESQFKGNLTWDDVLKMATDAKGSDPDGYRYEMIKLVETAKLLSETSK